MSWLCPVVSLLHTVWVVRNTVEYVAGYWWGRNFEYHTRHQGIDSSYVDGLSLTPGASRSHQHIWTFAGGLFTGNGSSSSHPNF